MMAMRLESGQFFGRTLRERSHAGLSLTLSAYQPLQAQPWHVHANPTFFLLISGDHRDQVRHHHHDQPALTLAFHPTAEPHTAAVGPRGMLGLNIEYDKDWLERHGLTESALGGYRTLTTIWSRLSVLRFLATAFTQEQVAFPELETQTLELLEPLVTGSTAPEPLHIPPWFSSVEALLREQFRSPLSLRTLAQEVAVHPVYLARVFRRCRGCTVSEYVRALRLAEAGRLIVEEGWSLGAAAYESGFADQAHFSRSCHRELGFSPKTLHTVKNALQA